jgi:hypothetical protein
MYFMSKASDKNGLQLQVGDEVIHVANPKIKGKVIQYGSETGHYLGSSWIDVVFDQEVQFSGNPGRSAKTWSCSACLLIKV